MSVTPAWILLLIFGLPLFAAILLLRAGRKRWIGSEPHCRACHYLLHGLQSERCPECGAILSPAAIRLGEPHRRWTAFLSGWLIIILFAIFTITGGISVIQNIEWYHYKPTHFVMRDLNSGQLAVELKAWTELMRRDAAGSLSAENQDDLVKFALARQANAQPPYTMLDTNAVDYLGSRCLAGNLPKDQQAKFFGQSVQTQLVVRAKVIAGDPVPYLVVHQGLEPTIGSFWTKWTIRGVTIDGKKISRSDGGYSASSGSGSGTIGSSVDFHEPGKHELTLTFRAEIFHGPFDVPGATPLYQNDRTLTKSFEILATKPANFIQAAAPPSLAAAMQAAIVPNGFHFSAKNGNRLDGNIQITNAPQNIACDVYLLYAGTEYRMNPITYTTGSGIWGNSIGGPLNPPPPATVDIILRPSEEAARGTVDLYGYWNEELVFHNVPVSRQ